jgi:hypothetical protein
VRRTCNKIFGKSPLIIILRSATVPLPENITKKLNLFEIAREFLRLTEQQKSTIRVTHSKMNLQRRTVLDFFESD